MDKANVPALLPTGALARLQEAIDAGMSPALAIMLDETLFEQVQRIAGVMSKAEGFVPKHCVGKTEVCFAITTRSLVWRLDPFAVAQSTYQPTEGAKVAYEAKLVQAILEQSGRLVGGLRREYRGDWSKVQGKFKMNTSDRGKKYAAQAWPEDAEAGLSIVVSAKVKGEAEPREVELELRQCHPRNSTLWATDPKTQIYYRAARMLGNVAMPGILMGVPFLGEEPDDEEARFQRARDVSETRASAPPADDLLLYNQDGEEFALAASDARERVQGWCLECTDDELTALIENNADVPWVADLVEAERSARSDPLHIRGMSPRDAVGLLQAKITDADATEADHLWRLYRERVRTMSAKAFEALERIVLDKIAAQATPQQSELV